MLTQIRKVALFDQIKQSIRQLNFKFHIFAIALSLDGAKWLITHKRGDLQYLTARRGHPRLFGMESRRGHKKPGPREIHLLLLAPHLVHIPLLQMPDIEVARSEEHT